MAHIHVVSGFSWTTIRGSIIAAGLIALISCSGGGYNSSPTSPTPSPTPTPTPTPGGGGNPTTATITIANNAVSPQSVTIAPGGRVTFVNNDTRPHDMSSDPHPEHTDCPEINQVGFLRPGESRATGNLNTVRVCGFHDHDQDANRALQGTIRIQ